MEQHDRVGVVGQGEAGIAAGEVNSRVDSHFVAQSVIGICNGLGELIVRDPETDVFGLVSNCTELLLNGIASEATIINNSRLGKR